MTNAIQIAIFAKAPVPGYAKTRLIPLLGPVGAADLHALLVRRTIRTALSSSLQPVSLWCTPDRTHQMFGSLSNEFSIDTHAQCGDSLGARMSHAFETLTPFGPTMVIGTDCACLTADDLRSCATALRNGAKAVFIPAEDGGYALVGLHEPTSQLFADIPWGTSEVMVKTRERLVELGLGAFEARQLWDIDTPEDYRRAERAGLLKDGAG